MSFDAVTKWHIPCGHIQEWWVCKNTDADRILFHTDVRIKSALQIVHEEISGMLCW